MVSSNAKNLNHELPMLTVKAAHVYKYNVL